MSTQKVAKMKVHACGGAGISLANNVITMVKELGTGFADIDTAFLDTSKSNLVAGNEGDFHQIKSKNFGKEEIDGSGSERSTHANDIVESIKDYLDAKKINTRVTGEFHLVMFSASGGSGSVIGPMLIKSLLERNIPTVALVVGDSSNGLSAINTLNTIATLNNIAIKASKPLSVMYVNNRNFNNGNLLAAQGDADKAIFNSISTLALFLSGTNTAIDNQDMISIIDQSNYSRITVKPGLYAISTFSKIVELPQGVIATVGRSLSIEGISPDIGVQLLHHKAGNITDKNAVEIYNGQFPIHMVATANFFKIEEQNLKTLTEDYYAIMDGIEVKDITGTNKSSADDNGLIL